MPRSDGSMTGRWVGSCTGGQHRNKAKSSPGRGTAGRVMCNWFNASDLAGHPAQETESRLLREQADVLRRELDEVNKRLSELGN